MTAWTRSRLKSMGVIVLIAVTVTPMFNWATDGFRSIGQGILDALLISIASTGYLFFVRDGLMRAWVRRSSFAFNLAVNSAVLVAFFVIGRGIGQVITTGEARFFMRSLTDDHLPWASALFVVLVVGLMFLVQMNRMIGQNVLGYFVMGSYHRPRDEERAFLFIDLVGSTGLAEELGGPRYYLMLRQFVDLLTEPVLESRGQIYQYAGDEVVVTWRMKDAVDAANCVRCYFLFADALETARSDFERAYGHVPAFRAGLHGGSVIAGELGDLKQEIVYVGDALNVGARLEEHAKRGEHGLVVSDELLARTTLPDAYEAKPLGAIDVRGRVEGIAVSEVVRREPERSGA